MEDNTRDFDFEAPGASVTLASKKKKKKSRKRSKRDPSLPESAASAPLAEPRSKRRRRKKKRKSDKKAKTEKAKTAATSHVPAQDADDEGSLTAVPDVPAAPGTDEIPLFATDPSGFIDSDGNIIDSEDGTYIYKLPTGFRTMIPVEFDFAGGASADPPFELGRANEAQWWESDSEKGSPKNSTEEPETVNEDQGAVEDRPQPRASKRAKRKALAGATMVREGRKTKPAPTMLTFSCSRCDYSVKNRFDSLRRHFRGKHKLEGVELAQECAKYKDKSRKYTCEKCGKVSTNIWEHLKGNRCPAVAAERKLQAAAAVEKAWSARREREAEDVEEPDDEETGRIPSDGQLSKDIETTGDLLKSFWRYCTRSTGTAEGTASCYGRYVK